MNAAVESYTELIRSDIFSVSPDMHAAKCGAKQIGVDISCSNIAACSLPALRLTKCGNHLKLMMTLVVVRGLNFGAE